MSSISYSQTEGTPEATGFNSNNQGDYPRLVEISLSQKNKETNNYRGATDLVRSYLTEIGRVPLLKREEEVTEAQKIQKYSILVELRSRLSEEEDELMQRFVELINLHDQLAVQLSHRPSFKKWAQSADTTVADLRETIRLGKQAWAQSAGLTVQELEQIQKEGVHAKNKMIKANLRLVVSVAKKYQNRGLELLDLIQEGTLGLERAVEKFDPTKGYRFSTYSYWWIRQGITRAIATQSRTIRLPVHITEKLNKIKKAQREIAQQQGHTATLDDVGKQLNMTTEEVREVLAKVPRSVSLEIKVGREKDTELGDLIETEDMTPEELLIHEAMLRELGQILATLTTREQEVIQLRFGLTDGTAYSLAEIGRVLNLSRERVRQIESKALQKLRQPKRRDQMQDYLDILG